MKKINRRTILKMLPVFPMILSPGLQSGSEIIEMRLFNYPSKLTSKEKVKVYNDLIKSEELFKQLMPSIEKWLCSGEGRKAVLGYKRDEREYGGYLVSDGKGFSFLEKENEFNRLKDYIDEVKNGNHANKRILDEMARILDPKSGESRILNEADAFWDIAAKHYSPRICVYPQGYVCDFHAHPVGREYMTVFSDRDLYVSRLKGPQLLLAFSENQARVYASINGRYCILADYSIK